MLIFVSEDLEKSYVERGIKVEVLDSLHNIKDTDNVIIIDSEMCAVGCIVQSLSNKSSNVLLIHNYVLSDIEKDNLVNVRSVYLQHIESLTMFELNELYTNTNSLIDSSTTKTSVKIDLGEQARLLASFLKSIDTGSVESITDSFNTGFDKFKTIDKDIIDTLDRLRDAKRELQINTVELQKASENYNILQQKLDRLVSSGVEAEKLIEEYSLKISDLEKEVESLTNLNVSCKSTIQESTELIKKYMAENKELKATLDSVRSSEQQYKQSLQQMQVENNTLIESLNNVNIKSKDMNVQLFDMGRVSKVVYVKFIDFVPYVINMFKMYQKRSLGKLKSKVGICIVCEEDSCLYAQYDGKLPVIDKDNNYIDCEKTQYILRGFSSDIKHYITNCDCELVFVLDTTLTNATFLECAYMEHLFVVNNPDVVDLFDLNPYKCITQNHTIENAIHLKYFDGFGKNLLGPILDEMNVTVFSRLDSLWR